MADAHTHAAEAETARVAEDEAQRQARETEEQRQSLLARGKEDLIAEADRRGLATTGTKAELADRIVSDMSQGENQTMANDRNDDTTTDETPDSHPEGDTTAGTDSPAKSAAEKVLGVGVGPAGSPYPAYDVMSLEDLRSIAAERDVAIPADVEKSLLITELRAADTGATVPRNRD